MMDDNIWLGISNDEVLKRLMANHGYTEAGAVSAAKKIANLTQSLRDPFRKFWESNQYADALEVNGFALHTLVEKCDGNVVGAFLAVDWLMREPEVAKKFLEKKRVDFIVPSKRPASRKLETGMAVAADVAVRSLKT